VVGRDWRFFGWETVELVTHWESSKVSILAEEEADIFGTFSNPWKPKAIFLP
jgi:hypothetical protein